MEESIDKIRQEAMALIIDECKRYLQELRKSWEEKSKLTEQKDETIADLAKQVEKVFGI